MCKDWYINETLQQDMRLSSMQSKWIRKRMVEIYHGGDIDVIPRDTFPTTGSQKSATSPEKKDVRADMRTMHAWSEGDHILV